MLRSKSKSTIYFIIGLLALICFYPYEFYSVYFVFLPDRSFETCLLLFIPILVLYLGRRGNSMDNPILWLSIIQLFGFLAVALNRGNINFFISQLVMISFVIMLVLLLNNTIGLKSFVKKYNRWILIMALLGLATWILVTYAGLTPLYPVPDRAEQGRFIYNYGTTFAVLDESTDLRFSGFFDEPGAMAYWGMYALVINKMFIKDKYLEIPLIISLIFTFSLGFYIQLVAYILLFYVNKKNIGKSIVYAILAVLLYFGVKTTEGTDLDHVYQMTIGRVEHIQDNSDGGIAVDDREESTIVAKKEFFENPFLGTTKLELDLGNNIYEPLALYGIIGSFLILFPFVWLLFKSLNHRHLDVFRGILVIVVGFMHRPFRDNPLYFFVLYSIILLYYQQYINANNCKYEQISK